MKYIIAILVLTLQIGIGKAQIIDKIDGIVDKKIILRSDIESQVQLMISQGEVYDNMHCEIFSQLAMGKLLVAQAAGKG